MNTVTDAACAVPPLALTSGDPAGIGPDLALMAWTERRAWDIPAFVLIADADMMAARALLLGLDVPMTRCETPEAAGSVFPDALPVLHQPLARTAVAGHPDTDNGAAVLRAIDTAVALTLAGQTAAVVTNPIAKYVLYDAGFAHPGHTEYLHALSKAARPEATAPAAVMLIASDPLNVVPLTIHVPLQAVPALVTAKLIKETVRTMVESFQRDFKITTPRIAVAGLNPHAGEHGTIGREDEDIIRPAIGALRLSGLDIRGPLSADTMFHASARATYDAALTMYHDQGLVPAKTLAFETGVNATLGLAFVRTSPDHGTAFELAGTGRAVALSLVSALKLAEKMATNRQHATGDKV